MQLESLRVLNLSKKVSTTAGNGLLPEAFCLDSCQRRLWVCSDQDLRGLTLPKEVQIYAGSRAYEVLLRVTAGLESLILGETDIFGQFKTAYKAFAATGCSARVSDLNPWIQRVFEDTKEIRSRFLQNQGGDSYGSLVRRMLHEAKVTGPVLLLGAGQLAASVGPFLLEDEIFIENRSAEKLAALRQELLSFPHHEVTSVDSDERRAEAWSKAAALVVCIPYDEIEDEARIALWQTQAAGRPVIHLGELTSGVNPWKKLPGFHSLDELFALQKSQGEIRSIQTHRAFKACEERAKLRALGASVSIPHGWEDLAVFA